MFCGVVAGVALGIAQLGAQAIEQLAAVNRQAPTGGRTAEHPAPNKVGRPRMVCAGDVAAVGVPAPAERGDLVGHVSSVAVRMDTPSRQPRTRP